MFLANCIVPYSEATIFVVFPPTKLTRERLKKSRNRYNNLKRNDKNAYFATEFKKYGFGSKLQWELVNRSKGKVTTKMSKIAETHKYCENNMSNFYWERTKLAAESIFEIAPKVDLNFPIKTQSTSPCPEINIEIDNDTIDSMMRHKPSPSPDPDGLSMQIWSKLYFSNYMYRNMIRTLFYKSFLECRIPGLRSHDVRLHPKKDDVAREKDIRPVASLASIPKRMLKIVVDKVKEKHKDVFFAENDFSAPGRGATPAIITTYETLERYDSGSRGTRLPHHQTRWISLDYSNAFATYSKKDVIENLAVTGTARQLLCNAIVDQCEFRVRTKKYVSPPQHFDVGGPQGQCGSCEIFASIGKNIHLPEIKKDDIIDLIPEKQRKKAKSPKKKGCFFVDDRSIAISAHNDAISFCQNKIISSVAEQSKRAGLVLNEEKTEILTVKQKPIVVTKFLGAQLNSDLTAKHECDKTIESVRKSVSAVRATSCLDRPNRIQISKAKIFSCLTYLVFIYIFCSDAQIRELGRQISISFKKSAYIHMQTSTKVIENFLYGMPFLDYCKLRFMRIADKMEKDGNHLFENMYEKGRKGIYKPKRGCPIGTFSKKYIEALNTFDFKKAQFIHKNRNTKLFFRQLLQEDESKKAISKERREKARRSTTEN